MEENCLVTLFTLFPSEQINNSAIHKIWIIVTAYVFVFLWKKMHRTCDTNTCIICAPYCTLHSLVQLASVIIFLRINSVVLYPSVKMFYKKIFGAFWWKKCIWVQYYDVLRNCYYHTVKTITKWLRDRDLSTYWYKKYHYFMPPPEQHVFGSTIIPYKKVTLHF